MTRPRLSLLIGEITDVECDAFVNVTNSALHSSGGPDGAVYRAGGPQLVAACREVRRLRFPKGLPVTEAVATIGGALRARWVIHTVGPAYSPREDRSYLLSATYRNCLRAADEVGAQDVAFPPISSGLRGWPLEPAARIAVGTLENTPTLVRHIRIVLRTAGVQEVFAEALARR
ncbi:MAG TPA: macro domain-containing protein [Actinomycetes bacterium]|nr:macro domain-containing protein [Actinomycetes bacterium]